MRFKLLVRSLIVAQSLLVAWVLSSPAGAQVVYRETFDHYGYSVPTLGESSMVAEWPPSLKHLEFRPTKMDSVYRGGAFKLPAEAQGLTDYEFEFLVRFPREGVKAIDVRLDALLNAGAKSPKYSSCSIRISDDMMGVASVSNVQPLLPPVRGSMKETPLSPLLGGHYYRCIVHARGKRLEAFLDGMGKTVRLGSAEIAGGPLAGFNFSGATAFDLDDICLRRIPGVPAEEFHDEEGARVANVTAQHRLDFPAETNTARATVRIGQPGEMRILLNWADGSSMTLSASTAGTRWMKPVIKDVVTQKDGKPVLERKQITESVALPDAALNFREIREKAARDDWRMTCNVRPWIDGYLEEDRIDVAARWETFEAASRHFFTFEVRRDGRGIEYWIDGRYCGRRDNESALASLTFILPAEGAIKGAAVARVDREGAYLPLDIRPIANPGVMASARLPIAEGGQRIAGIPFLVAPGQGNLDLSVVKENFGTWALECDFYLSRTAFSGMPETLMLSVPSTQYTRAYLLCAVADDPSRDPVLTARLTRFASPSGGGRGPAIVDTTVELPRAGSNAALPPGVQRIGEVDYTDAGHSHRVPLYLVEVPLDSGRIQDVIFQEQRFSLIPQPYLDFEVLGRTDKALQQLDKEHKPDPTSRSAVHVFAVTLKRSPVEMEIVPARPGNAYTTEETPSMNVRLRWRAVADCRVAWQARDVDGRVVDSGEVRGGSHQPGKETSTAVTPKLQQLGHYKFEFRLVVAAGEPQVTHRISMAIVAPDTRKAGYESPYFTWWFNGAHFTSNDVELVGPLLKMAGVHRTFIKSEALGERWKLTTGQINNVTRRVHGSFLGPSAASEDLEAKRAEWSKQIDAAVAAFPHADAANIFHENCNGEFPLELYGIPMPLPADEKEAGAQKAAVAAATLTAQLYREKYPKIRPTLVNSGDSLGGAGMLMRNGIPREALTALGEESLGQTMPPEMSTAWNFWMLKELARKMGYGDVPVEPCHEWKGRNVRDLGERKVAAWRVRDALIAHAWGCHLVPVSGTIEPGNSYHNSVWGHDYMFSRSPQNYPYMSYSTVAQLTAVLDGAKCVRRVPTGSITVYALEFQRGPERIFTLWTARGTADLCVGFDADGAARYSDMFGRSEDRKTEGKTLKLTVSTEPCYFVAQAGIESIAVGTRRYGEDESPAGAKVQVADAMDQADSWQAADKPDKRLENVPKLGNKNYLCFRQFGKYAVRPVRDDEKGDCLEVELFQEKPIVPFLPEYTVLKLKTPVPIQGEPTTVGLWVKGNSGWGQVMWELEDAEGERWLSCGTGGYGCDIYDWPKQASINFDGWNFIQFPIVQSSPIRVPNPGEVVNQWRSGGGNGRIDYPIRLTGIVVSMSRHALDLTEMRPVRTVVRLKDLSAY